MKIWKALATIFFLSSISVNAATISAGQWTTPAKIVSIALYDGASYRIVTDTQDNTSAVCSSSNGAYWWFVSEAGSKEILSIVMMAYSAGKKISIAYTDECNNSAKRIRHIVVSDN
ncbi:hypothetical protein [Cellvibrio mixtus]|uniref:hypothetical protein n=1 Tax=Cellvibrio mixtus TaxID=39650 RepID=UPI000586616C|nr:hypothetical protein [Cellvibrio mixtus]